MDEPVEQPQKPLGQIVLTWHQDGKLDIAGAVQNEADIVKLLVQALNAVVNKQPVHKQASRLVAPPPGLASRIVRNHQ